MELKLIVQFFCCINCHCLPCSRWWSLVPMSHHNPINHSPKKKTRKKMKIELEIYFRWEKHMTILWQRIKVVLFPQGPQYHQSPNSSHLSSPNSLRQRESKCHFFVIQIKYHLHYIPFLFHQRHKVRIDWICTTCI